MPSKHRIIQDVQIVDTGHKGVAIGKTPEGVAVMVSDAVPGDRLDVLALRKRKGMYQCIPQRFITYSPFRTDPRCHHFGICGGCKWQHMTYAAQLQYKEKAVHDALSRIAQIHEPPLEPILGCESAFHYRNKMEYTFTDRRWLTTEEMQSEDPLSRDGLGLHIQGAFAHVTDITTCHLQPDPANAIRNFVRDFANRHGMPFQNVRHHTGFLRNLVLRNTPDGLFMVTVVFGEDRPAMRDQLLQALADAFACITSLYYCINPKLNDSTFDLDFHRFAGEAFLPMQLGHITYKLGPKSFFQTNNLQAEAMCRIVREFAALRGDEVVYDLYSGIGSFALYLARESKMILGIEEIPEAVDDARVNAQYNGIHNAQFLAGDVRKLLHNVDVHGYGTPDLVITDPPRAGMDASVVESLLRLNAPRIVYVSCNPATQARDIALLSANYRLDRARPIDMFPQTAHVENVALLIRRS
jgi:23S rRNA (uracil1939-C5)-methyltransferase